MKQPDLELATAAPEAGPARDPQPAVPAPQRDLFADAARRPGGAAIADLHASLLKRAAVAQSSAALPSLLRLQRHYGNRHVRRVCALARRGEGSSEVAPEVETAIESSRGAGHSLDAGTRHQMEPAFGADFSGVRIHTGSEADSLNRAVSAVAFTTGQDIFFRDGAYNPGSSAGRELLAHELTHVVQQSDGKKLQGKLTVGEPDDAYEQEADQMAKEVVHRVDAGDADGDGALAPLQRACSCGGSAGGGGECEACRKKAEAVQRWSAGSLLQREVTQPVQGGAISLASTAQLTHSAGGSETVTFPKDTQDVKFMTPVIQDPNKEITGTIRVNIDAIWSIKPTPVEQIPIVSELPALLSSQRTGEGHLSVEVPFRVPVKSDGDTAVKPKPPRLVKQVSTGTGAALDPQPAATADPDDTGLSVTVSPRVTYQQQNALAVQGTAGVPVISPTVQVQSQTANTQAFGASFTADLTVSQFTPPAPKHYDCTAKFGPFVIASDHFEKEDEARQQIHDWYFDLDPAVRQDLEAGKGILRVTGRASTTGPSGQEKTFNLALAEKRAKRVNGIIADFAGSNAHLNSFALGQFGAQTQGEDPNERRVDVEVSGDVPGDQAAKVQGDGCSGGLSQPPTPTGPTGPTGPVTTPAPEGAAPAGPAPSASGPAGGGSSGGAVTSPAPTAAGSVPATAATPAAGPTASNAVEGGGQPAAGLTEVAEEEEPVGAAGAAGGPEQTEEEEET